MKRLLAFIIALSAASVATAKNTLPIYAPTNSGTAGQVLISQGVGKAPKWDAGGGVDTNTVQSIIQRNIDTNHVASVEKLNEKRDMTNRVWIASEFTDWNFDSFDQDDLKDIVTNKTLYPNGVLYFNGTKWQCLYGTKPTDEWELYSVDTNTDPDTLSVWIRWDHRYDARIAYGEAVRTKLVDQVNLAIDTDLTNLKNEIDAQKRGIKDFYVPEYLVEDYVPWHYRYSAISATRFQYKTGGGRLIQGLVSGTWYTIMETDETGRLTLMAEGLHFRGATPSIGDKVAQLYDEIVLYLDARREFQTNLVYTTNDNGKVLGVVSNKMQWVEQTGGTNSTDTLILNGDEDLITGPYVIPHGYGETGQVLISQGTNNPPTWSDHPVMVLNGTDTNYVGACVIPQGYGQKGQILVSKGTNDPPEWSDQPIMVMNGTITNSVGPVIIPGGYGQNGQLLVSNGTNTPTWLVSGTAEQILVSNGANKQPAWKGTETPTFTKSSYVSTGNITMKKFGKVVTINFQNFCVSSTSSGMLIGTISTCKPSGQRATVLCRTDGGTALITVNSEGNVNAWNLTSGTTYAYYGSLTYIIE